MPRLFDDSAMAVAAHILTAGPISRADAARDLHFSPASLTRLVRPLIDGGLVGDRAVGASLTGMGRPTRLLEFADRDHRFVGVNITKTRVHAVVVDCRATVTNSFDMPLADTGTRTVSSVVRQAILRCVRECSPTDPARAASGVRGIGISLGGTVRAGTAIRSRFLGWSGVPLVALLDLPSELPTPLLVNDVEALTELERWFGLGGESGNFVLATVGAGIGHGVVHGRRSVTSPVSGYGMTSHLPLLGVSGMCQYGHQGCADGALTTASVLARARMGRSNIALDARPSTLDELVEMADGGDVACQRTIEGFGAALAVYVQVVCNSAMVTDVVLDGELVTLLDSVWARTFRQQLGDFRGPHLPPLDVHLRSGRFERWAQAAATTAIIQWLTHGVEETVGASHEHPLPAQP
ncbi:MAG: ROK family transcriptional regulator [Actinomyces sp.]|nr:ROK family transcriptional regulator [Actinomyces sp.]